MRRIAVLTPALLLAACGTAPRPPGWVAWSSEAPPPEKAEIFGPPERPGQVWMTGHWARRGDAWEWQPGTYVTPPAPDTVWVPGCWIEQNEKWTWTPGSWRPYPTASAAAGSEK